MFRTLFRVVVIAVLGSVLGLLSNALISKGIPLIAPPKQAPKPDEFIPLDKAQELWSTGATIFLDARSPLDYEAGHIANALNLPVEQFQEFFPKVAPRLSPDGSTVVYCDGEECELSHRLTEQLNSQGYTNVHMLFNGWTTWSKAGYPTETGPGK